MAVEPTMLSRNLRAGLEEAFADTPVVFLTRPGSLGKSGSCPYLPSCRINWRLSDIGGFVELLSGGLYEGGSSFALQATVRFSKGAKVLRYQSSKVQRVARRFS
jgi:hypothetical protein